MDGMATGSASASGAAAAAEKGTVAEIELAAAAIDTPAPPAEPEHYHHHAYVFKRLRRALPPPSQRRLHAVLAGLMVSMVLCGWTDGSVGPLVPSLQKHFNINYLLMSLIYTTGFAGSMIAGLTNIWITDRLGVGLVIPLGALASTIAYMLMGTGAHYAVFLVAFAFNGFGLGIQDAQVNNLCSRLPGAGNKMMVVQACFGLGGTIAPLAATAFAQHVEQRAYLYFFVAMGVALIAMATMLVAFDMRTEEQIESWRQAAGQSEEQGSPSAEHHTVIERDGTVPPLDIESEGKEGNEGNDDAARTPASAADTPPQKPPSSGAKMKRIFSTPSVYALMAFSFLYIGIEVAISSWSVTFLRRERGGTAAAGYVTTGFWGGMTVSRVVLIPVTNRLGYQFSIYLYSLLALALELVIWFTHSLVGNGVCYAFVGFFLGPVYPVALMVVAQVYDDDLRGGVMGLMGSIGGAGAAAVPFIAGAVADRFGIWTIQPIAVAMIAGFVILWAFVPTKRKPKAKAEAAPAPPSATPAEH